MRIRPKQNQAPQPPDAPTFGSVSELLHSVDTRLSDAKVEGARSLAAQDAAGYAASREQETEILAGLGELVGNFRAGGGEVPEGVYKAAIHFSTEAQRAREEGGVYTSSAIMPLGSQAGGPTVLGILADREQPPVGTEHLA